MPPPQADTNGKATYSPARSVPMSELAPLLQAYPNPAHAAVSVCIVGERPTAPLQLSDALGRLVRA